MERDSFVFYKSFMIGVESLSTDEEKLKAYNYIIRYGITWEEPEKEKSMAYTMFILAKPQIDANNKRYEKRLKTLNKKNLSSNNKNNG